MRQLTRRYNDIAIDYSYDGDIFNGEPDRVRLVKYIINKKLNQVDRTLIILYADCHSYRELGARLNLSRTTIWAEINRIKKDILEQYEQLKDQCDYGKHKGKNHHRSPRKEK